MNGITKQQILETLDNDGKPLINLSTFDYWKIQKMLPDPAGAEHDSRVSVYPSYTLELIRAIKDLQKMNPRPKLTVIAEALDIWRKIESNFKYNQLIEIYEHLEAGRSADWIIKSWKAKADFLTAVKELADWAGLKFDAIINHTAYTDRTEGNKQMVILHLDDGGIVFIQVKNTRSSGDQLIELVERINGNPGRNLWGVPTGKPAILTRQEYAARIGETLIKKRLAGQRAELKETEVYPLIFTEFFGDRGQD